jgi:hypothetical protein
MENTIENEVIVLDTVATPTVQTLATLTQAQIVANVSLTDAQRKALREYAVINNVALRGDYNDKDNTFDSVKESYTMTDGIYDRDTLRVNMLLTSSDEAIKTQLNTSDLGTKSLEDLQGCFVKVKTVQVVAGQDLPFKRSADKTFKKATTSFTWAKDFNVLTNNALAMILAMS